MLLSRECKQVCENNLHSFDSKQHVIYVFIVTSVRAGLNTFAADDVYIRHRHLATLACDVYIRHPLIKL